ncbi:MAG: hypothetical protein A3J63_04130 [Candidatus Moranbacteria bacterium RIFCSPHIGHO2_02_FULL_40_12b]|nr:MAG: hypothetical protein A3J63_04130 [Candidatus Moranbacteria bacterium RIFCSPHIGHO2_02_FULL_40_12b]OGI24297.1 MAG: hypothetical protein A3E91_01080 [Candidatus Moranbacteria bacterium RIFCSPHIGHO2_12_FULL_40_10]
MNNKKYVILQVILPIKTKMKNKTIINTLILAAIVLSALFLRLYKINYIPAGLYPDETVNGTDAILANDTGNYEWFYTNNYGREGLFMNLISFSIRIFGNTILGLKIWSIIFGTLTVLGVFLLAKELFKNSWRAGIVASYFTAFSFWSINFSRISFRANMLPFILVFSFYFLFRGIRTKKFHDFILSGLIFGIGLHTYIAFRLAPAIPIVLLAALVMTKKSFFKEHWKFIMVFLVSFLITASPMLIDFWKHPDHFSSRTGAVSIFSPEINKGHPIKLFVKTLGLSLAKYNFWGDQNWRHNYPPYPILQPAVGVSFLIGFLYLIVKTIELLFLRFRDKIRDEKLHIYIFLLSWFFVMLAPEFLTEEGLPHALRSIGTLPAVFIISAIPVLWIFWKIEKMGYQAKIVTLSILTIAFVSIPIFETTKYFFFWAKNPNQHGQFDERYKNIAIYFNNLPDGVNKYVFANGHGREMEDGFAVSAHVVKYLTHDKAKNLTFLKKGTDAVLKKPMVFIPMDYEQNMIDNLKKIYPSATINKVDLNPGFNSDFTVISINKISN